MEITTNPNNWQTITKLKKFCFSLLLIIVRDAFPVMQSGIKKTTTQPAVRDLVTTGIACYFEWRSGKKGYTVSNVFFFRRVQACLFTSFHLQIRLVLHKELVLYIIQRKHLLLKKIIIITTTIFVSNPTMDYIEICLLYTSPSPRDS